MSLTTTIAALTLVAGHSWIPFPQRASVQPGELLLPVDTTVSYASPALAPLAAILARDVTTVFSTRWTASPGKGRIQLLIDPKMAPEEYRLTIGGSASIAGGTYQAVAMGATTLLQSLTPQDSQLSLPKMEIRDRPTTAYRGLMIDVARKHHSISVLKQCVELARLYKIRYLQLHLTDDQAFTFPSQAFPKLSTSNEHPAFWISELKDLVRYADERGVTVVPEIDLPGHAAAMIRTMPELFKIADTKPYEHHATINFANDKVVAAVDTLVGEFCEVFRSSPYFHMGGDEADISNAHQHPDFQAAFKKHGLQGNAQHEIFRLFIQRVNEMVKKRGKQLIVWEGFGREPNTKFPIPKDVLIMEFESAYYLPNDLLEDGYTVINTAWTPLYVVNRHVWPAKKVYEWDLTKFGRFSNIYKTTTWFAAPSTKNILGGQVCSWEQPEHLEIANLRRILPAMAERVWNPSLGRSYEDFAKRLTATDKLLDRLIQPVTIRHGRLNPPTEDGFDVPTFTQPIAVKLSSRFGEVRYTLDGTPPTSASPVYKRLIVLRETTTVRAIAKGSPFETSMTFYYERPKTPNLATGKPVTVSGGTEGAQTGDLAVDDNLDLSSSWWANPGPQWLQVDLQTVQDIGQIEVFPYWDGSRYYQYTVETSIDGKQWTTVADRSANTVPASAQGDSIKLTAQARYVRVHMLKNSANPGVHLVELKVWPKEGR